MKDQLVVRGARVHNLKDVSIELPRDQMIVFTGLSGSANGDGHEGQLDLLTRPQSRPESIVFQGHFFNIYNKWAWTVIFEFCHFSHLSVS